MSSERRRGGNQEVFIPKKPSKPLKPEPPKVVKHASDFLPSLPYAPKASQEEISLYREKEKELLERYRQRKGKCPLCGKPVSKGIIGHISKCIRRNPDELACPPTSNSSNESPTTT